MTTNESTALALCGEMRTMELRALLTNKSSSCEEVPMGESSLVVGAGVIGSRVAGMLAERGDRVSVISRRGSGPAGVAADAADAGAMARLAEGAAVIYNCVNPPYHRWPADWPPIAASVLAAAERSGAVLVTLSNLYGYGPRVPGGYDEAHPMTEATPLAAAGRKGRVRARIWQDALAAHQAGRVRVAEVRAADFVGLGAQSAMGERIVRHVRQGKRSRCSAAPTGRTPGRSPTTWPGCWLRREPTPRPGDVPGTCRRMSHAPSARSSTASPGPPGSIRSGSARSPRPSCPAWGSPGRSCGNCARPSTSSATTSSWTPQPRRPASA